MLIITTLSVFNVFVSSYTSHTDKKELNDSLAVFRADNYKLRRALDENSIKQSELITKGQKKSADDLNNAANNLVGLIEGSQEVPLFRFVIISDTTLSGVIKNYDYKPVYNIAVSIHNFDNLIKCKTSIINNIKVVNRTCHNENRISYGLRSVVNGNSEDLVDLPKFLNRTRKGRFLITIKFKSKIYKQEAIYEFKDGKFYQSLRVVELKNDKVIKAWVPKILKSNLTLVNWAKEFPSYYIHDFKLLDF